MITTGLSTSLDGFIAGPDDDPERPLGIGGERLFKWFEDGDTPSRFYRSFRMSAASAKFFDAFAGRTHGEAITIGMVFAGRNGAVITGRRTYDIANAWGGDGPLPGVPLFIMTHRIPKTVPTGSAPYTFVTDGIERAVEKARSAAGGKDVSLMGATPVQQALRAGLLDILTVHLVPVVLGRGVRLLDGLDPVQLDLVQVVDAPDVTHLTFRVGK